MRAHPAAVSLETPIVRGSRPAYRPPRGVRAGEVAYVHGWKEIARARRVRLPTTAALRFPPSIYTDPDHARQHGTRGGGPEPDRALAGGRSEASRYGRG